MHKNHITGVYKDYIIGVVRYIYKDHIIGVVRYIYKDHIMGVRKN